MIALRTEIVEGKRQTWFEPASPDQEFKISDHGKDFVVNRLETQGVWPHVAERISKGELGLLDNYLAYNEGGTIRVEQATNDFAVFARLSVGDQVRLVPVTDFNIVSHTD